MHALIQGGGQGPATQDQVMRLIHMQQQQRALEQTKVARLTIATRSELCDRLYKACHESIIHSSAQAEGLHWN